MFQPGPPSWSAPHHPAPSAHSSPIAPPKSRTSSGPLTSWLPKSYSTDSCRHSHYWGPPGPGSTLSTSGCTRVVSQGLATGAAGTVPPSEPRRPRQRVHDGSNLQARAPEGLTSQLSSAGPAVTAPSPPLCHCPPPELLWLPQPTPSLTLFIASPARWPPRIRSGQTRPCWGLSSPPSLDLGLPPGTGPAGARFSPGAC